MDMYRICAFGDSVMKGIVEDKSTTSQGTPKYIISRESFVERCSKLLDLKVENYARFGGTVPQGMNMIDRHLDEVTGSNYVIVEYGGNDCSYQWADVACEPDSTHYSLTKLDVFINQYEKMIDKIKVLGVRPIMFSLPMLDAERYFNHISQGLNKENILKWLGGDVSYIDHWHEMYNMAIFGLAARKHVPIIDITSAFLEKKDYRRYLCSDGIHPNEAGHELIANSICSYVHSNSDYFLI